MKPLHSHAIDHSILAIGRCSPERSNGGYGTTMRCFVALKTASRLVDMGFATAHPKLGAKASVLQLTPTGRVEFDKLRAREEARP